jgi:microcystin-dependent protein
MSTTLTTPYMNLMLPIPTLELGPAWAFDLNSALGLVDSHNHTAGMGQLVPVAGLNINADLPLNGNNLTLVRSTRYNNQSTALTLPADINSTYVVSGNLFYNNATGQAVQITNGTTLNISGTGTIGGDYGSFGVPASVVYFVSPSHTYYFYQDTNQFAPIAGGPLTISGTTVSANGVTIGVSNTLAAPYSLTLPSALPSVTSFVTSDNAGQLGYTDPSTLSFVPTGAILAYGGASAPSLFLLCDGSAVSRTTYSSLFTAIGVAYGAGDGSTTFNLPDGRGFFLRGVDNGAGHDPDASSRAPSNTGGNSGDAVGSSQGSAFESHVHVETTSTSAGGPAATGITINTTGIGSSSTYLSTLSAGTSTETRPINIYVNYIIKT